jgi:hypothetical protein
MKFSMTAHAIRSLLLCLGLAGCGGGSLEIFWADSSNYFIVFESSSRFTTSSTVELDGKAFLPQGAHCSFPAGPFGQAGCICDIGPLAGGQWTNGATGAVGRLELSVATNSSCAALETSWRTPAIALAPGTNFITLSFFDGTAQGGATVTVVRN